MKKTLKRAAILAKAVELGEGNKVFSVVAISQKTGICEQSVLQNLYPMISAKLIACTHKDLLHTDCRQRFFITKAGRKQNYQWKGGTVTEPEPQNA